VVLDHHDTYDSANVLSEALDSLRMLRGDYEVVLINNNDPLSTPRTTARLKILKTSSPKYKLVETGENKGCAGGFNAGAAAADPDSEILIYMSPDALIVDPDALICFEHVFGKYPKVGLAHPVSIYEDANDYNFSEEYSPAGFYQKVTYSDGNPQVLFESTSRDEIDRMLSIVKASRLNPKHPTWSVPLTFLAIRKSVYDMTGPFDEMFLCGGENTDFTLRALKKGYSACVVPNSLIFHRRLLFRYLGSGGKSSELVTKGLELFNTHWKEKWNGTQMNCFMEIRYGKLTYHILIKPFLALWRRLGVRLNGACRP